ncbi:MAG: ABC transporter ATP-binding protein [Rhizobiaceae bacterium]|nr:ABC transporter ATP-binding protein [Rhizobiaceae bacterium]
MIVADNLHKSYDNKSAILRDVSFNVHSGEVYTLLGPSGCGKTTSLRSVAGLDNPDRGRIVLGDKVVFSDRENINVSPDRRNLGMVFQSYAVWPHMTVSGNVTYPLLGRGLTSTEIRRRVGVALETVGLSEFWDRPAPNLSGGQQQRVALARAIVGESEILLLDEPLSNLDAKLREQMREELTSLQRKLRRTMIYVTHDQHEALALSDRIGLMRKGLIVEEGRPETIYQSPRHPFTAEFLGSANFIPCVAAGSHKDGDMIDVDTPFGKFRATVRAGETAEGRLFFRQHNARISAGAAPASNAGTATVTQVSFLGETRQILAMRDNIALRFEVPASFSIGPDAEITFTVDPGSCIAFLPVTK